MIKKYPSHWVITELENAGKVTTGNPAPQEKQYFINGITPFVRVADLGQLGDSVYIKNTKDKLNEKINNKLKLYPKGSVLFTKSGMSLLLNQRAILGSNMYVVSHIGIVIPNQDISSEWIYYWFKTIDFKKYAHATTLPSLKISLIRKMNFPLPPLNEQTRIVEKIEELFSDLDKATEDLKKTQEQLIIYRQAVLKAAFEGKLTEEWRQTRKEACNIKYTTLNNMCIKVEKIKNEENSERKIKYLDIGSIDNKVFKIVSHKTYQIKNAPSRAKQIVKEGDTLFSTVRTYLKNIAYVHSEYDNEICSTGFCVIRPKKDVLTSRYIFYYVISDDFVNRVSPLQTGTSYPAVRDDDILKQTIPLVTIDEQKEIVNEIESRLSVCDKLEETVQQSLEQIDRLRQSILKKAFEGKLVSQDPNDLPACELLKQIKIEKDKMSKNGK